MCLLRLTPSLLFPGVLTPFTDGSGAPSPESKGNEDSESLQYGHRVNVYWEIGLIFDSRFFTSTCIKGRKDIEESQDVLGIEGINSLGMGPRGQTYSLRGCILPSLCSDLHPNVVLQSDLPLVRVQKPY